jgi:hypothetical protein
MIDLPACCRIRCVSEFCLILVVCALYTVIPFSLHCRVGVIILLTLFNLINLLLKIPGKVFCTRAVDAGVTNRVGMEEYR